MTHVALEIVQPHHSSRFVEPFLRARDIAEPTKSGRSRILGTEALGDKAIRIKEDVRLDLLTEVSLTSFAPSPHLITRPSH